MKNFIGTKIIKANPVPITQVDHFDKYNVPWEEGKQGANDIGYTIGYPDQAGDFDGPLEDGCHYIFWISADVFESMYRPMSDFFQHV